MLIEIIEEIQQKVLNLLLFDELIHKNEKQKLLENLNSLYFKKENKKIFEILENLNSKQKEVNIVTLLEEIKDNKQKNKIQQQLLLIQNTMPTSYQVPYYVNSLYNNCIEELIINAKNDKDIKQIKEIQDKYENFTDKIEHISYKAEEWKEILSKKAKSSVFSLFQELDESIGCFQGGDYITLGGGTGQGKTMFALNLTKNILLQDKKVLYCSLEMPIEQLQNRFNCLVTGVNANKIRQYNFDLEDIQKYDEGMQKLKEWPLYVTTDYKLTIEKLEAYIKKNKPDFVIIDYLGLMSVNQRMSLYEKITQLSRQIKVLATEYNIPILVLVQLNREIKNREDKRPVLSDIRESGAIEQDSDFVLFVHREWVYNHQAERNKIEIVIAKNRHGESGKIVKLDLNIETQAIT